MNSKLILAALLIVGTIPFATAPFATASHFSVGTYDAVGLQPTEAVDAETVPPDGELFERGTSTTNLDTGEPCAEYTGNPEDAEAEATTAASADPFCGALVYNQGTGFVKESPIDQDFPLTSNITIADLEFDVVTQSFVGAGLGTCAPFWCVEVTSDVFQDAAANTGLTGNATEHKEDSGAADGFGYQGQSPNLGYPNAYMVAQQATGLNEGNGWIGPSGESSFFAFLSTPEDDSIDDVELAELVNDLKAAGELPANANPSICAFTPDASISISAGSESFCEVTFTYYSDDDPVEAAQDPSFDDYGDDCGSPTYVCGTLQPGWYANLVMLDRPTSTGDQASHSTTDYDVWHFVVAPSASPCSGAAEPGFAIDTGDIGSDATAPYLAHDLDIYTPSTGFLGVKNADSLDTWSSEFQDRVEENTTDPIVDQVNDITALELAGTSDYTVAKERLQEPNAPGDTSQDSRTLDETGDLERIAGADACSELTADEEFFDPWVNVIDVFLWQDFGAFGFTPVHDADNNDPNQDAGNTGGPGLYYMDGYVGMFTDKNDDGDYDTASGETSNKGETINSVGAYPLWMDMQANKTDDGWEPAEGGCNMGFSGARLTDEMVAAGYGLHTGVVQVLYLNEPTVLVDFFGGNNYTNLAGNTAYVFTNQALGALYQDGEATAVGLVGDALEKAGLDPAGAGTAYNLAFPGHEVGYTSDFGGQCRAETGEISPKWEFFHSCQLDCSDDVLVTAYYAELTNSDGTLGGNGALPLFDPAGDGAGFDFSVFDSDGDGIIEMYDVDPLTDNPDDNTGHGQQPPSE